MRTIILNMITTGLLLFAADLCYSQNWLPVGQGIGCNGGEYVTDINIAENGNELLIAGTIARDGNCDSMRSALYWDGNQYSQIADNTITIITTLAFDYQDKTYCSGFLVPQPGNPSPLKFNRKTEEGLWELFPNGIDGSVMDYTIRDNIVYLAGAFSYCGGVPCGLVCTFDGEQVLPYYQPSEPHTQYALGVTFYQDTLFVAGTINSQNSTQAYNGYSNLLKVVNGQLEKVAQGFTLQGMGVAVEVLDEKLYVGGWLQTTDNPQFHSIYYYQDGQLHTLPEEPNNLIFAMTTYQDALYVAGGFTQIGNMPCNNVARWDGHEWTCLTNEPFERVVTNGIDTVIHPCSGQCIKDIVVWNDTLYIGGSFHRIGTTETKLIAKLDMALSEAFPVSVSEQSLKEKKLRIYPNPTLGTLNVMLPDPSGKNDLLELYDVQGRLIHSERLENSSKLIVLNFPQLAQGMYIVRYNSNNKVLTQSFIKE